MDDINIKAKISVETGDTGKSVENVQNNVKGARDAIESTSKKTKEASGSFSNLKDSLGKMPGPIGMVANGLDGLKKGFTALIANPVGLMLAGIVATLALLYKAFTNTFAGAQKVEEIFAGIKATAQSLLDNLDKVGSAIKNVFTFNFSEAKKDLQDIGNAAVNAYGQMAKLTKQAQGLKKEQLQNDLEQAERQKRLAILREEATDETIPLAKRKAALLELKKDAEQNAKDDIELAKKVTENKIAQLTLQKDGALKNQEEINRLKIEQINVETDNANELRRIAKQVTAAEKQEQQTRAENAKAIKDAAKAEEEKQKALDKETEQKAKERRKDLSDGEKELLAIKEKATEKTKIDDEDQIKRIAERGQVSIKVASDIVATNQNIGQSKIALSELEKASQQEQTDLAMQSLDIIGGLVDKNSVAGKGIAVATAVMNTYEGASKAIAQGGVFGPIAAAATIAAGLINVKKIISTKIPSAKGGGDVGGVSSPSLTAASPIAPMAFSTQLNSASIQGIGNAAAGGINRAYVLESDINNSGERQQRLQRASRLG